MQDLAEMATTQPDRIEVGADDQQEHSGLDEASLRRADFRGGRAVTLADGQPWYFPLPVVHLVPVRLPSGRLGAEAATQFGPGFDRLLDELAGVETVAEEAAAIFAVAADLLGRNYDLAGDQLRSLVQYRLHPDGPGPAMEEILRIALGRPAAAERDPAVGREQDVPEVDSSRGV